MSTAQTFLALAAVPLAWLCMNIAFDIARHRRFERMKKIEEGKRTGAVASGPGAAPRGDEGRSA